IDAGAAGDRNPAAANELRSPISASVGLNSDDKPGRATSAAFSFQRFAPQPRLDRRDGAVVLEAVPGALERAVIRQRFAKRLGDADRASELVAAARGLQAVDEGAAVGG